MFMHKAGSCVTIGDTSWSLLSCHSQLIPLRKLGLDEQCAFHPGNPVRGSCMMGLVLAGRVSEPDRVPSKSQGGASASSAPWRAACLQGASAGRRCQAWFRRAAADSPGSASVQRRRIFPQSIESNDDRTSDRIDEPG